MVPTATGNNPPFPRLPPGTASPLAPNTTSSKPNTAKLLYVLMAAFADGLSPRGKFRCLKAPSKLAQVLLPACRRCRSPWLQLPACKHGCGGQPTDRGSSSLSFLEAFTDAVHRNNSFFCQRLASTRTELQSPPAPPPLDKQAPCIRRSSRPHPAALPAHSQAILTGSDTNLVLCPCL